MRKETKKLKICIDARIADGEQGGLQQVVIGLASRFSNFNSCEEEYSFLSYREENNWLKPFIGGPCKLLYTGKKIKQKINKIPKFLLLTKKNIKKFREATGLNKVRIKISDGTIEKSNIDIMHFTKQDAFLTKIPSIYQPHDLQHLHYPNFFSKGVRKSREKRYRLFCDQAQIVIAMTKWGKNDLVCNYELKKSKVKIVPWAPIVSEYEVPSQNAIRNARQKYKGFDEFIFYPAQTWEHKNHIGIIKALSILKEKYGKIPKLICSGKTNEFYDKILRQIKRYNLENHVKFTGFVSSEELQCLYRLCKFLVFPSKFEGWGLPITEAFHIGVPVACSNIAGLPDMVGDAAILFNPDNPNEIAEAIWRLYRDEDLRHSLIHKGKKRGLHFSWQKTAKLFRAHYRKLACRKISDKDKELLFSNDYF